MDYFKKSRNTGGRKSKEDMKARRMIPRMDKLPIVTKGLSVWYVDTDSGEIEEGKVFSAYYKDGKLDSFSVDFKESKDFDEFSGIAWGACFFPTKKQAVAALKLKKAKP